MTLRSELVLVVVELCLAAAAYAAAAIGGLLVVLDFVSSPTVLIFDCPRSRSLFTVFLPGRSGETAGETLSEDSGGDLVDLEGRIGGDLEPFIDLDFLGIRRETAVDSGEV